MTLPGATDTPAFQAFVEQVLAPTLKPGQVVVMDNLSPHKNSRVRELIEQAGCVLWYLPPYSPDLNPIELCWSKMKESLRGMKARTMETLQEAVTQALQAVTPQDARNWFRHAGYR